MLIYLFSKCTTKCNLISLESLDPVDEYCKSYDALTKCLAGRAGRVYFLQKMIILYKIYCYYNYLLRFCSSAKD